MSKIYLIIFCFISIFYGCGKVGIKNVSEENINSEKSLIGSQAPAQRNLEYREKLTAINICQALKFVREYYPTRFSAHKFIFEAESGSCANNGIVKNEFDAIVTPTHFSSSFSGEYFNQLQTDQNGLLKHLCPGLIDHANTSVNPMDNIGNTISTTHNTANQFSFEEIDASHSRVVVYEIQNKIILNQYDLIIRTSSPDTPSTRGMVTEAKLFESCPQNAVMKSKFSKTKFLGLQEI